MRYLILVLLLSIAVFSQSPAGPPMEFGVSHTLAKWRVAHYSDVRYKLNLTLEKMSPVLKGTMEIRVKVSSMDEMTTVPQDLPGNGIPQIILDWRRIAGHEKLSTITNVTINGQARDVRDGGAFQIDATTKPYIIDDHDHLIFAEGVKLGENVIKLDFTSPILTSGSAITRYIDKEDGSEYIYSLFVPSDASTAFPVFDQPDLKARFELTVKRPKDWNVISNALSEDSEASFSDGTPREFTSALVETRPISTYLFAFAAGPFERFWVPDGPKVEVRSELKEAYKKWLNNDVSLRISSEDAQRLKKEKNEKMSKGYASGLRDFQHIYVRKSQAAKFQPHAAEVFRLNREAIKYFEEYFDYKFPFPKYDIVLVPEFPFGGMEHAGATFLRESAIIFPTEPTKSDEVSRAVLMFHEAAHQWFGDTVTMKWFDDLWLKEGFANFMAYKALEKIMPEANAWKVFYERIKQPAYATDSTKGTTAIYQPIENLSAAKSAYGNIVYNKAPAFLRQAEFYLGEDKFKLAVCSFLKKHEYANATWQDLVYEFGKAKYGDEIANVSKVAELQEFTSQWVTKPGLPTFKVVRNGFEMNNAIGSASFISNTSGGQSENFNAAVLFSDNSKVVLNVKSAPTSRTTLYLIEPATRTSSTEIAAILPNYQDYGYGIFLLDDKSRDYVLKNVQNEKDAFLRSMMYGALWDSVREGELDPKSYVELVIKNLGASTPSAAAASTPPSKVVEQDESIVQSIIGRAATAMRYYMSEPTAVASGSDKIGDLNARFEAILLERMQNAQTTGQRITFFRALVANATTEKSRAALKQLLTTGGNASVNERASSVAKEARSLTVAFLPVKAKDRFDIVTRLLALNDPDAMKLLADLEKTETSDDAKRYAYAARAAIPTKENKAKYWNDFVNNKDISESWIEAAFGPWNNIRHSELTLPYLQKALLELPNHKRNRKIFFVNGWLGAFIGGQRSDAALAIINKFLDTNPNLDKDLRLKILENSDLIERAVRVRGKYGKN